MTAWLTATSETLEHRLSWRFRGARRPAFAVPPNPDQESVWDYPRPPRIVRDGRLVEVRLGRRVIAKSRRALRVLETASPPTFYLPPEDVRSDLLAESGRESTCEWKGSALDLDLIEGPSSVAWRYPHTYPEFETIAGWFSFYPAKLECFVSGERVRPQPGGFYPVSAPGEAH
jgi:uncharacterized protein (DUF427 family)